MKILTDALRQASADFSRAAGSARDATEHRALIAARDKVNHALENVPPTDCPICSGQREWVEVGQRAMCYFCGETR